MSTSSHRDRPWWRPAVLVLALGLLIGACACSNDESSTTDATTLDDAFESLLVGDLSLTPGEARCVKTRVETLFDDGTRQLLVRGAADATAQTEFDEVLGACAFEAATPADSLARRPGEPFTYGDDAELDRLWDECAASGTDVCDDLFNRAPEGSEYEAFANSCGGRGVQVACAPGASAPPGGSSTGDPTDYGDDPALDQLWDQCAAGDDQACLTLEFQAPAGSAYAAFAASCGNRPDGCQ
jgi:hypothetical protein